ncbi:hypothetical protein BJ912DRAFT_1049952 [Pholiota molesta]|nr:hypothetical protein BJ912DRAFT_1049952 [Pholiota molesta]
MDSVADDDADDANSFSSDDMDEVDSATDNDADSATDDDADYVRWTPDGNGRTAAGCRQRWAMTTRHNAAKLDATAANLIGSSRISVTSFHRIVKCVAWLWTDVGPGLRIDGSDQMMVYLSLDVECYEWRLVIALGTKRLDICRMPHHRTQDNIYLATLPGGGGPPAPRPPPPAAAPRAYH